MHGTSWRARLWRSLAAVVVLGTLVAIPAAGAPEGRDVGNVLLAHVSQAVASHYFAHHPNQATGQLAAAAAQTPSRIKRHGRRVTSCESKANKDVYNCDEVGFPQNEESITACPTNTDLVLGGTNDFRGLLDPEQNFTGWHWSIDGGQSVKNEGLLPPVRLI